MICTLSKHAAERKGYADALMFDWRGQVAEATGANIFFVKDGKLHTPTPDCFLDGITRQTVIGLAKARGIEVIERAIMPEEMAGFEQCFLTGTAAEVTPVSEIGPYKLHRRRDHQDADGRLHGRRASGRRPPPRRRLRRAELPSRRKRMTHDHRQQGRAAARLQEPQSALGGEGDQAPRPALPAFRGACRRSACSRRQARAAATSRRAAGRPGFVKALDAATLVIPDFPGNNRLNSLENILENGRVGMLFLVPGVDETLRVNGRATIDIDPELRALGTVDGKLPIAVIRVAVEQAYLHCGKALMRSALWDPANHVDRATLPSIGEMIRDQVNWADGRDAGGDARPLQGDALLEATPSEPASRRRKLRRSLFTELAKNRASVIIATGKVISHSAPT